MSINARYDVIDTLTGKTLFTEVSASEIAEGLGVKVKAVYNAASRRNRIQARYAIKQRYGAPSDNIAEHSYSCEFREYFTERWNRIRKNAGIQTEDG